MLSGGNTYNGGTTVNGPGTQVLAGTQAKGGDKAEWVYKREEQLYYDTISGQFANTVVPNNVGVGAIMTSIQPTPNQILPRHLQKLSGAATIQRRFGCAFAAGNHVWQRERGWDRGAWRSQGHNHPGGSACRAGQPRFPTPRGRTGLLLQRPRGKIEITAQAVSDGFLTKLGYLAAALAAVIVIASLLRAFTAEACAGGAVRWPRP